MATFAPSWTFVCSSPSICFAESSFTCIFDFTSASRLSPSACTVFSSSWASETTFWMSRAIGLLWPIVVLVCTLRIEVSLRSLAAWRGRTPADCEGAFPTRTSLFARRETLCRRRARHVREQGPIRTWERADSRTSAADDMRLRRAPTVDGRPLDYDPHSAAPPGGEEVYP